MFVFPLKNDQFKVNVVYLFITKAVAVFMTLRSDLVYVRKERVLSRILCSHDASDLSDILVIGGHRTRLLSVSARILRFSKELLHKCQRGHLSRHSRWSTARKRRPLQRSVSFIVCFNLSLTLNQSQHTSYYLVAVFIADGLIISAKSISKCGLCNHLIASFNLCLFQST